MLYLLFIGRLLLIVLINKLLGRIDEYFARYIAGYVDFVDKLFGVSMDKAGLV